MTTRKHNEFLDLPEDSDDENKSQGYDSEAEDLTQTKGTRSIKRRRVTGDGQGSSNDSDDDIGTEDNYSDIEVEKEKEEQQTPESDHIATTLSTTSMIDNIAKKPTRPMKKPIDELPGMTKPLTKKNLVATEKAIARSGVIYISRVPPFMKPQKLRSLLEPFGSINRIFLTPEDPQSHTKRVRSGGNKKRSFTDGWVEFINKSDAKKACELLNAQLIGGKKGNYYRDDVWNLKYLKGYKWGHLTEQIASENAERAARMRVELSKNRKENKEFVANVERSKIERSKREKAEKLERNKVESFEGRADKIVTAQKMDEANGGIDRFAGVEPNAKRKRITTFAQTSVAPKKGNLQSTEQARRVSKIF